jgi:hypothetical protein
MNAEIQANNAAATTAGRTEANNNAANTNAEAIPIYQPDLPSALCDLQRKYEALNQRVEAELQRGRVDVAVVQPRRLAAPALTAFAKDLAWALGFWSWVCWLFMWARFVVMIERDEKFWGGKMVEGGARKGSDS